MNLVAPAFVDFYQFVFIHLCWGVLKVLALLDNRLFQLLEISTSTLPAVESVNMKKVA
jgi:hypothetical protein